MQKAQQRMKYFANKKRFERTLQVGDWVFLKLQSYRQTTVVVRENVKHSAKFCGPYPIIEIIGIVAYRLQLPPDSLIHLVSHISKLKKTVKSGAPVQEKPPASLPDREDLA